jgi:dTDP-4-amino-4,6-dideoxygalactose transaminase
MTIELFRPSVPKLASYQHYLERMDSSGLYSNFGPLHSEFSDRLAQHFSISIGQVQLFNNGTFALIAGLRSLKQSNKPYCLLPSWTFVATAQAVVEAGLEPIFVDVDINSMQLTAEQLNSVSPEILNRVSVVLIVAPYGAPLNYLGIEQLKERYGFNVLCDCAAGFESIKQVVYPTMVSLHATKTFGIGEAGLLLALDDQLIKESKAYSNFGFKGQRSSIDGGVNGKLSEITCAVGLGLMDCWIGTRSGYYETAQNFINAFGNRLCFQEGWGVNWVSSTCVIRLPSPQKKELLIDVLSKNKIDCRDWWNQGCHNEPFFKKNKRADSLKNTENLAKTTLGIPFFKGMSVEKIDKLSDLCSKVLLSQ